MKRADKKYASLRDLILVSIKNYLVLYVQCQVTVGKVLLLSQSWSFDVNLLQGWTSCFKVDMKLGVKSKRLIVVVALLGASVSPVSR